MACRCGPGLAAFSRFWRPDFTTAAGPHIPITSQEGKGRLALANGEEDDPAEPGEAPDTRSPPVDPIIIPRTQPSLVLLTLKGREKRVDLERPTTTATRTTTRPSNDRNEHDGIENDGSKHDDSEHDGIDIETAASTSATSTTATFPSNEHDHDDNKTLQ
ncbi:hypothetical protein B0T17DRAFT_612805 [Bombardia bombarda]|uniref:Uncharacterized protein n=1 Tax=Bombardia bombarda TaxID=252184 RepID=A0AA39XMK4_9PEZI|nr:hypothetical protein B0T17DRAFT_612805 [Bombardia bombarda]